MTTVTTITTTTDTTSTSTASSITTSVPTTAASSTTRVTTTTTSTNTTTLTTITTTTETTTTTTAPYCLTRITFDDIPGQTNTSGLVPNGYKNLNWTNTYYLNVNSISGTNGYRSALVSSPYVAYNPGGASVVITSGNGSRFSFDSVLLAAAWRDNLQWNMRGYRGGTWLVNANFAVTVLNTTTISCGSCSQWDTIVFMVSGGTPTGLAQNGTEIGFDDLCISFGY